MSDDRERNVLQAPSAQSAQSLEQQKMEALGRIANAVAHDFNNLLATIQLTMSLLAKTAPAALRSHVDEVGTMIELGRRLTQQIMIFGRERTTTPNVEVDLRSLLDRMTPMIRAALGRAIRFDVEVPASDPVVVGDPPQLEAAVLSLALHARDTIRRDGEIIVTVRDACEHDEVGPSQLVLEMHDTGEGLDDDERDHLFEHCFAPKREGHASFGVGLASVYDMVQRAGGTIRAQSAKGAGTTITVALPRAHAA